MGKSIMDKDDSQVKKLCQYLTPAWAAEALVERHFGYLSERDIVIEPTCGQGAFLSAIPPHIKAIGIEIDPQMAERARQFTGRDVIVGDFCAVPLDIKPTAIIGNPPFDLNLIDRILDRCHSLLVDEGRVGFILPCYAFQTASRVARYAERWSLMQEMIPRNIYPCIQAPLAFAQFIKAQRRILIGFSLYRETAEVQVLPKRYRDVICAGGGPIWLKATIAVLEKLGGEANLQEIYEEFEGKQPTTTKHWRPQIRKVVREHIGVFRSTGPARYALK